MSGTGSGGAVSATIAGADPDAMIRGPAAPTIAFIGTRHAFSPCMARTVSSEIADAGVAQFDNLEEFISAPAISRATVRLMFIDAKLAAGLLDLSAEDLSALGTAIRAVAYENASDVSPLLTRLREEQGIKGFLPMHVRLDVWLSIIRLLSSGGGYVPEELIDPSTPPASEPAPTHACALHRLTPRETEVLQLVARGVQNKTIATTLKLSQHTVKLHIHHIISKLGVRNRTEAAARFFERVKA